MKVRIWAVVTCIPERGEKPCQPVLFGSEAAAIAYADARLRQEWADAVMQDEEGNAIPYPGDWETANRMIAETYEDGSWGQWLLTFDDVEVPSITAAQP